MALLSIHWRWGYSLSGSYLCSSLNTQEKNYRLPISTKKSYKPYNSLNCPVWSTLPLLSFPPLSSPFLPISAFAFSFVHSAPIMLASSANTSETQAPPCLNTHAQLSPLPRPFCSPWTNLLPGICLAISSVQCPMTILIESRN